MDDNKKLGLAETILFGVCTVLVIDTVALSASAGTGAFIWWLIILVCFFLPYGLVTAELSTTFPADGGIYDWVKRAYGRTWAARTAWLYWINFALWIPAVYYLFAVVLGQLLGIDFSPWQTASISIVMSWIAVLISLQPVADSKWVSTLGAICKVTVMGVLGIAGIVHIINGNISANPFSMSDFIPDINTGLSLLSVAIFGLVGFEVVGGAADSLKNPDKDIPTATIFGGLLIAFFYLLSSFGILSVIPVAEIDPSAGVYESVALLLGDSGPLSILVKVLSLLFLFTLLSNIVNWSVGVNYVARYAALNDDMPKSFASVNKHGVAKGAAIWNGVVSTVVMVCYAIIATVGGNEDLFWNVFSLGAITLLMSYIIMFPAFLKLRKIDKTPRVYKMKGNRFIVILACYVPTLFLILGVVTFFWTPETGLDITFLTQVGTGVLISLALGEWGIKTRQNKQRSQKLEPLTNS